MVFSKGDFRRTRSGISTIGADDFLASTLSVWEMQPESARRWAIRRPSPSNCPGFIELYTYQGDLVLDPFLGSGTTAMAAVLAGRHYGLRDRSRVRRDGQQRIEAAT